MRRAAVLSVLLCSAAVAADAGADGAKPAAPLLGERVSGPFDVSFKPFSGAKLAERPEPGEISRYTNDDKHWLLAFTRFELPGDLPLRDKTLPDGSIQVGYLGTAVTKLRSTDPNADVLRSEVIDLGDLRLGIINAVTHERDKATLTQQVIVEVTPRLFYALVMTSPLTGKDPSADPAAREAATVFKAITDSIERVDLSAMKRDQDERLFRTRGLFAQWSRAKMISALVPTRYLRVKRDGKDVGYVYAVEQPADALPKFGQAPTPLPEPAAATGFRVGTTTHLVGEDGKIFDTEAWMYATFSRQFNQNHEVWSTVTRISDPADKSQAAREPWFSELGASDLNRERRFDRSLNHDDYKEIDQKQRQKADATPGPYRDVDVYKLRVNGRDRRNLIPGIERDLPPWYLPQAVNVILPRLVPTNIPSSYLFATYQSDVRQVVMRYVDVSPEANVTLDGGSVRAIAIAERVGFAGTPTVHYVTAQGQYLGTKAADGKTEIVVTDKATLEGLWPGVTFREPEGTK